MTEAGTGVALPYLADAWNTPVDYTTEVLKSEFKSSFHYTNERPVYQNNSELTSSSQFLFHNIKYEDYVLYINSKQISRGWENRPPQKQQKKRSS